MAGTFFILAFATAVAALRHQLDDFAGELPPFNRFRV